jgi:DNA-3-methyladenine glycosylase I
MPPDKVKPPRPRLAAKGQDGKLRCPWPGEDPIYVAYHDEEWGAPEYDDRALFEKLVLDGFQAGLSWITILRKRPAFRAAFDGFEPKTIARWDDRKKAELMQDAGIVRNRAKIEATTALARLYLDLMEKDGFARHIWSFVDGRPVQNMRESLSDIPAENDVSRALAKDLRARGGNFVGPTIIYAFMQATGMVNDHLVDCWRCEQCRTLARPLAARPSPK